MGEITCDTCQRYEIVRDPTGHTIESVPYCRLHGTTYPEPCNMHWPEDEESPAVEIERLRTAISAAIDYAGGRWSEWGSRAEGVEDILLKALNNEEVPDE